jgi:hypothetical protein
MDKGQNKKIEDILNSLDGVQKVVAPDFFYTRLKAKMLAQLEGGEQGYEPARLKLWLFRPVYAVAALIVVILINAAVIFNGQNTKDDTAADSDILQSVAAEYALNDNSTNLYDLNMDK